VLWWWRTAVAGAVLGWGRRDSRARRGLRCVGGTAMVVLAVVTVHVFVN
jgi:hypothetical protein